MRITQNMISNNVLSNLSKNYSQLAQYQDELASGQRVTKPSDDPVAASLGIGYRSDYSRAAQYQKNVAAAQKWMSASDSALSQAGSVLDEISDLTLSANNSTQTSDELNADATQIDQLTQQLVTIGNTQIGGQYIFSGADSENPLLTQTTDASGNTAVSVNATALANPDLSMTVNDGVQISVNVNPKNVFTSNMFADLSSLKTALQSGDQATVNDSISKIASYKEAFTNAEADIGAREQRVNLMTDQLNAQQTNAVNALSTSQGADYAKTVVSLNQQQNVFQASLAAGARIIQQSLVNYLQ
ncbi:MAG: flagellar hook-associated protein FlgL [Sporolactobacillus sp.]